MFSKATTYFMIQFEHLLLEWSVNDPIPELTHHNEKLAIFLIGAPGSGKTFFCKSYIFARTGEIKVFNVDNVSLTYQKNIQHTETPDENIYTPNASALNVKSVEGFLKVPGQKQNFIYEMTGNHPDNFLRVYQAVRSANYTPLFIHIIAPLKTAIARQTMRNRQVPEDYVQYSYKNIRMAVKMYSAINPNNYYMVVNDVRDNLYKFYKLVEGKLKMIGQHEAL